MTTGERMPRPVRAEAGEPIEVRLTVNGTATTLRVPARMTLSDALRDHLGLTGTHVGCEHGVCGMCTVLVDGQAARACLLFAVQLDGAEIVTVEGLGKPDQLHPLQRAFGRNHALQCGFCTPGFLMSAYDLLTSKPDLPAEDLPAELSGVICRCTGYRNIVTAVRETLAEFGGDLPGPANCGERALVGRASGSVGAVDADRAAPEGEQLGEGGPVEITLPEGAPTIALTIQTTVAAPSERVWDVFDDVHLLARCLPGAELTADLGDNAYAGRAKVSAGPVRLAFSGVAKILAHDRAAQRLRVLARGQDTGGSQTQADIELRTEAAEGGTVVHADAKVYLTGRIAQFGRALAGEISRRMFEQFAASVAEAATSGQAPAMVRKPPSAVKIILGALGDRLRSLLRRGGRR